MDTPNGSCLSCANHVSFPGRDFGAGRAVWITVRKMRLVLLACFLVLSVTQASYALQRKTLTQLSTIGALMHGVYDGEMTIHQLQRYGNTGLGTLNALDGEMIILDGTAYQVRADGTVHIVGPDEKTPFAAVTFFKPDLQRTLSRSTGVKELAKQIDAILPSRNLIYVLKIEGTFKEVVARSVPRQHKPYKPLAEVAKSESIFRFKNVKGTVVGIRCPAYMERLNVPGYHLHFLTADRKAGGHVLDISVSHAVVKVDTISDFYMILPQDRAFYNVDMEKGLSRQVTAVESGKK